MQLESPSPYHEASARISEVAFLHFAFAQVDSQLNVVSTDGQRPLLGQRVVELFAGGWMAGPD